MRVEVKGADEAQEVLREYVRLLEVEVDGAHGDEAGVMVRNVRSVSPVVKGDYRSGWRTRREGRKPGDRRRAQLLDFGEFGKWIVENLTRHAVFVEDRYGILQRETERAGERVRTRLQQAVRNANRGAQRLGLRR